MEKITENTQILNYEGKDILAPLLQKKGIKFLIDNKFLKLIGVEGLTPIFEAKKDDIIVINRIIEIDGERITINQI